MGGIADFQEFALFLDVFVVLVIWFLVSISVCVGLEFANFVVFLVCFFDVFC